MNESKWSRSSRQISRVAFSLSTEISCCPDAKQKQKSFGGKPGGGDLLVTHSA